MSGLRIAAQYLIAFLIVTAVLTAIWTIFLVLVHLLPETPISGPLRFLIGLHFRAG
ncbi:hypothetical protein [Novosphingobium sp. SG707]|uniref:hypothetical protein n=1 Tax=Novosphingobium sp. SG707 TaxID=2586996 RepID=UPI001447D643|nr:hypothetical protein [Novosphingobium sp. SG707]NKJ00400.1 hypothetical protein [Novosphingobium sp. SG707]